MDALNGFRLMAKDSDIFATVRGRLVTFSRGVSEILDDPSHVHLFADEEHSRFALKASENDSAAYPFYQEKEDHRQVFTRLTLGPWIEEMASSCGVAMPKAGIRVYGEYSAEDDAVIFDFRNTAKPRTIRKKA